MAQKNGSIRFRLTNKQRSHVRRLNLAQMDRLTQKYIKGAKEHGGSLEDQTPLWLVEQALDECIDQFTYLHTLYEKLRKQR